MPAGLKALEALLGYWRTSPYQLEGAEHLAQVGQRDGKREARIYNPAIVDRRVRRVPFGRDRAAAKVVLPGGAEAAALAEGPAGVDCPRATLVAHGPARASELQAGCGATPGALGAGSGAV